MKNKTNILIVLIIHFLILLSGCITNNNTDNDQNKITGSGNIITIEEDFKNFSKIELNSVFEATIIKSTTYSIVLRIDENIEDYLILERIDNTLKIGLQSKNITFYDITNEVTITLPDIESLIMDGATNVNLSGFNFSHKMEFNVDGASTLTGNLSIGLLDIIVDGVSTFILSGNCTKAEIIVNGVSTVDMGDLITSDIYVEIDGTSNVKVNVNGTLRGTVRGLSKLYYFGNPILKDLTKDEGSFIEKME